MRTASTTPLPSPLALVSHLSLSVPRTAPPSADWGHCLGDVRQRAGRDGDQTWGRSVPAGHQLHHAAHVKRKQKHFLGVFDSGVGGGGVGDVGLLPAVFLVLLVVVLLLVMALLLLLV